jgi:hypothetical protein
MFILTLVGKETGVFSLLNDVGEQVIPLFIEFDDANRYNIMMHDLTEKKMPLSITEVDQEIIVNACVERDQKYAIITPDDLLIPPEDVLA